MKSMFRLRIIIGTLLFFTFMSFVIYNVEHYVSLTMLKTQKDNLLQLSKQHPLLSPLLFFLLYVIFTALSIPGSLILTLAGGALFGVFKGLILVSFASTTGATLAFLSSRYFLRSFIQEYFSTKLKSVNDGFSKEGGFYIFSLRLIPIVPFSVLNLVLGLTNCRTLVFFGVSQIGMLPSTIVFVDAGTKLASLQSPKDIVSLKMMASFVAIGVLPLVLRRVVEMIRNRRGKAQKNYSELSA
eukprot:CAMPEP_0182452384 /NCGR_PEP_ID=MMETSP1172-20130603/44221_1 /TAXON_ID=708627 /ORGANISM="Timspurckia oligopyrenoides, Strain CCMP3278" /LENGTH=240 /DNA_ID=CAMNT_0024650213 /DNA_START=221 /DNA_END=943 /DNA_ORIENTATION=+